MITSLLYLYFAAHGQLPFDVYWVGGLAIMDSIVWSCITPLFSETVKVGDIEQQ